MPYTKEHLQNLNPGDGATGGAGSDCYPYTVVGVRGNSVFVTPDDCRVISGSFMTGDAVVEYETRGDLKPEEYTLRKNGRIVRKGQPMNSPCSIGIGGRRYYLDPHF